MEFLDQLKAWGPFVLLIMNGFFLWIAWSFRQATVSRSDFEEFTKAFRSFGVNGKLKRATNFTQRYQVRSVPILVVNGKYSTDAEEVANLEQKLDIANELVEREKQRL